MSPEPDGPPMEEIPGWSGWAGDIQAVCGFRCWASKRTPFFQTINVMAAILRAKVRRAISLFDLRFESRVHRLQLTATLSGVRGQG